MKSPKSLAALHTHTHTHTSVLLNNKKTESIDSLIVVSQNKKCIEKSIQQKELKNNQEEKLINYDMLFICDTTFLRVKKYMLL